MGATITQSDFSRFTEGQEICVELKSGDGGNATFHGAGESAVLIEPGPGWRGNNVGIAWYDQLNAVTTEAEQRAAFFSNPPAIYTSVSKYAQGTQVIFELKDGTGGEAEFFQAGPGGILIEPSAGWSGPQRGILWYEEVSSVTSAAELRAAFYQNPPEPFVAVANCSVGDLIEVKFKDGRAGIAEFHGAGPGGIMIEPTPTWNGPNVGILFYDQLLTVKVPEKA